MSRILFIGDLNKYGRGYQRFRTLKEIGHDVVGYSHSFVSEGNTICLPTFSQRIFSKLRLPKDEMGVNALLKTAIRETHYDVIWIEKGNMIWPSSLAMVKRHAHRSKLVSCSEDDMYAKHGHSLWYRWGLRHYDFVFTTKSYNVSELKELGARKTILFLDSFDEKIHHPMDLTQEDKCRFGAEVSAIGAFEPERASSLLYLANHGVKVTIWGNGWRNWSARHPNLDIRNEFLFGVDYSKAISATKININFLRKINRDEVTSRSIEIPACGGFMLAERTGRHLQFFSEGKEAEYFDSDAELLAKVKMFLTDAYRRQQIAEAGRQRCLSSSYSMREQLIGMLSDLI